jgi:uncharacterized protein
MARSNVSLRTIQNFLAQKRIAMVGISREKMNIGLSLMQEFTKLGYDVVPVNPNATEIDGHPCYARVQDIHPAPDAVLILTSPQVTEKVVRDCSEAGVKHVWMYRGGGQGSVSEDAVKFCREKGIEVVPGQCPFMFLSSVHGVHRFHRFFYKITGQYPKVA